MRFAGNDAPRKGTEYDTLVTQFPVTREIVTNRADQLAMRQDLAAIFRISQVLNGR